MKKFNKKKIITLSVQLVSIAVLVAIDLIIKKIVVDNIALYEHVGFIEGLYGWTYIQNTGVAWGQFNSNPQALSAVTGLLVTAAIVYVALPIKRPVVYNICIPLIIAGGLANTIDRVYRGFVVDYIETLFVNFPVYNFADILVVCGAFLLAFYLIYEIIRDEKAKKQKKLNEDTKSE